MKILKMLLLLADKDDRFIVKALTILRSQYEGNLDIVGITGEDAVSLEINEKRVPFISLENAVNLEYDLLLSFGGFGLGMNQLKSYCNRHNLDSTRLIGDWIVCIPGFTVPKYHQLVNSSLSIFSLHCFGGIMSHLMGLPFKSPFVNLYMMEQEFIKVLKHPKVYLSEELELIDTKMHYDATLGEFKFPVYNMGNVSLYMQHYPDFEEAVTKWHERKARINWYNILAVMFTDDPIILEQFDKLPYGKKVCFVPFKSDKSSAFYISPNLNKEMRLAEKVTNFGWGNIYYYDPFDLLLYGKKTQLIEM